MDTKKELELARCTIERKDAEIKRLIMKVDDLKAFINHQTSK